MFRKRLCARVALGALLLTASVTLAISPARAGGHHQQTVVYYYPMTAAPAPAPTPAPTAVGGTMVPVMVQGTTHFKHHHAFGSTGVLGVMPAAGGTAVGASPFAFGSGWTSGGYYYPSSGTTPSNGTTPTATGSTPPSVGTGLANDLRNLAANPRYRLMDTYLGSYGSMSQTQSLRDRLKGALSDLVSQKGGLLPSKDVIENALLTVAKDFLATYGLGWVVDAFKPTILELIGDVTNEKSSQLAQTPTTTTPATTTTTTTTPTTTTPAATVTIAPANGTPAGTYQFIVTVQAGGTTSPATVTPPVTTVTPPPPNPGGGFPNVPADPRPAAQP